MLALFAYVAGFSFAYVSLPAATGALLLALASAAILGGIALVVLQKRAFNTP